MTIIELSIDESLLAEIDLAAQSLAMTRDEFIRDALETALRQHEIRFLEKQHEEGYKKYSVVPGEFDGWESEQVWEEP